MVNRPSGRRTSRAIPTLANFPPAGAPGRPAGEFDSQHRRRRLADTLAGMPTKVIICQHSVSSADYWRTKAWSHRVTPLAYRPMSKGSNDLLPLGGIAREFRTISDIRSARSRDPQSGNRAGFRASFRPTGRNPWLSEPGRPLSVTAGVRRHQGRLNAAARPCALSSARQRPLAHSRIRTASRRPGPFGQ